MVVLGHYSLKLKGRVVFRAQPRFSLPIKGAFTRYKCGHVNSATFCTVVIFTVLDVPFTISATGKSAFNQNENACNYRQC